jgi:hypothetical protein
MKKIIFFCFTILLLVTGFTKVASATTNKQDTTIILQKDQIVNHDYFAAGSNVTLHGTVNGDAYIAGGNVLIDGIINGDLIAAGGTIIINGQINHNIRVAGGNVVINNSKIGGNTTIAAGSINLGNTATLAGSLVGAGGELQLSGTIGKETNIVGGNVLISNSINGNVAARTDSLALEQNAKINGNLTYFSNEKAKIAQGATISGTIKQNIVPAYKKDISQGATAFFTTTSIVFKFVEFIAAFVIGLLLIYLLPVFTSSISKVIKTRFWLSFGIGITTAILTPILFIAMLITILGIPIAFIFLLLIILLSYFAKIYASYIIGEKIFGERKIAPVWILLLGLVVFTIASMIPVIGGIFQAVAILVGLGAILIADRDYLLLLRSKKLI